MYDVWKKTSGEYDPKDDKPIVDPRGNTTTKNETKFKYWAMEQYGMTAEEYRGYTFKGTGKTILETADAYFKATAPIDAKKGITYLTKKGITSKNILKATFGNTNDILKNTETKVMKEGNEIVEGVVKSRINIANGQTRFTPIRPTTGQPVSAGFNHVLDGHFNRPLANSRSIFSIPPNELKIILQNKDIVHSPVNLIEGGQYVRIVDTGKIIGNSALKYGGKETTWIKIFTDKAGNLITTYPVPAPY